MTAIPAMKMAIVVAVLALLTVVRAMCIGIGMLAALIAVPTPYACRLAAFITFRIRAIFVVHYRTRENLTR